MVAVFRVTARLAPRDHLADKKNPLRVCFSLPSLCLLVLSWVDLGTCSRHLRCNNHIQVPCKKKKQSYSGAVTVEKISPDAGETNAVWAIGD